MAASDELIDVQPLDVNFPPPFDRNISSYVKIRNPSKTSFISFKVRTTKPKRYTVHPNLGAIPPGDVVEVQLILNHAEAPSEAEQKVSDRFQIQAAVIDPALFKTLEDLKDMWSKIDETKLAKTMLKVRFKPAKTWSKASSEPAPSLASTASGSLASPAPTPPRTASPARPAVLSPSLAAPAAASVPTVQDKVEASGSLLDRMRDQQLADPANVALMMDERRRLKARVEELQAKLRETLSERDRLAARLRAAGAAPTAGGAEGFSGSAVLLLVLALLVAYLLGRYY